MITSTFAQHTNKLFDCLM